MTKIFQKSLASVLALALCLTALVTASATVSAEEGTSTTAPTLEYVVTPASPKKGETVKVELVAKNFNDVTIFGADIATYYDSKLELTADNITFGFKDGYETVTVDKSFDAVNKKIGIVGLGGYENGVYTPFLDNFNSTTLYSFEFVAGDAGTEYTFSFASDTKVRFCTSDEQEVTVAAAAKTVTVAAEAHTHTWGELEYRYDAENNKCITERRGECGVVDTVADRTNIKIGHALGLRSTLSVYFVLATTPSDISDITADITIDMYKMGSATNERIDPKSDTCVSFVDSGYTQIEYSVRSVDMASDIDARIYGIDADNNRILIAAENDYQFSTYVKSQYTKNAATAESNAKSRKYCALLADIVNYGAAAQVNFKYNTDNLANAGIDLSYATPEIATDDLDHDMAEVIGSPMGKSLELQDRVEVEILFAKADANENSYLKIDYKALNFTTKQYENREFRVDYSDFSVYNDTYYSIKFNALDSTAMPQRFTISLCNSDGSAVDVTEFSLERYAWQQATKSVPNVVLVDLMKKMAAYGRSAYAYFAS